MKSLNVLNTDSGTKMSTDQCPQENNNKLSNNKSQYFVELKI
jgi:hypothetical protein